MWKQVTIGAVVAGAALGAGAEIAVATTHTPPPTATPTAATQGNACQTERQEESAGSAGQRYRVVAWCDHIDRGAKVRGVLDTYASTDEYTPWFTTTNQRFTSDWRYPTVGVPPSTRIEYGQRELVTAPMTLSSNVGAPAVTTAAGHDLTVKVDMPADAAGDVSFTKIAPAGWSQTMITFPIIPSPGRHFTIPGKYLTDVGLTQITAVYHGDQVYKLSLSNEFPVTVQTPPTTPTAQH